MCYVLLIFHFVHMVVIVVNLIHKNNSRSDYVFKYSGNC
jgi:hypothetical protein